MDALIAVMSPAQRAELRSLVLEQSAANRVMDIADRAEARSKGIPPDLDRPQTAPGNQFPRFAIGRAKTDAPCRERRPLHRSQFMEANDVADLA